METLFGSSVAQDELPAIPGLAYFADCISEDDERTLVRDIDQLAWDTSWRRRRQMYGGAYGGGADAPPIPDWGTKIAERIFADGITHEPFNSMLVNEYLPGQGIALHRDYEPFGRTVASLSLLSPCVMDFRHKATQRKERLLLEPRSLLVLSDVARYEWEHGIAPRKKDHWHGFHWKRGRRLSVTFRTHPGEQRSINGEARPADL